MKIILIEADESKIRELERASAFTWEGMTLEQENIDAIANAFMGAQLVKKETDEIITTLTKIKSICKKYIACGDCPFYDAESNYPDDLPCEFNEILGSRLNGVLHLSAPAAWDIKKKE